MRTPARAGYAGYRFPADIIGHAVWLYFRFPLGLRMVEELLAARGIIVSHETVRQWARKFGQQFANQIHLVARISWAERLGPGSVEDHSPFGERDFAGRWSR